MARETIASVKAELARQKRETDALKAKADELDELKKTMMQRAQKLANDQGVPICGDGWNLFADEFGIENSVRKEMGVTIQITVYGEFSVTENYRAFSMIDEDDFMDDLDKALDPFLIKRGLRTNEDPEVHDIWSME